jgi:hypothetical protein
MAFAVLVSFTAVSCVPPSSETQSTPPPILAV